MRFRLLLLFCLFILAAGCSTDDPTRPNDFIPLTAIEVTGTHETMAVATINQFTALGNYSGSFTRDITEDPEVIWSTGNEFIATVSIGMAGLVTAHAPGETTVTATLGDISGSAPVIVTDVFPIGIEEIIPADIELQMGITQQYEAIGIFSDNSTQDVTLLAVWESSDPTVATIDENGLVTTVASGSANIIASWQGFESSTSLTVTDVSPNTLTILPASATIAQGTIVQFQAEATNTDGSTTDVTDMVDWQSNDNAIAIIDREGLAEGIRPGQTEISASIEVDGSMLSATADLTVTDAALQSIRITPENSVIQAGENLQYTATGTFSDNSQQDITGIVTWLSTDATVGIISNSSFSRGLFISTGPGTTFIEAFFNNVGDETLLTVQ